MELNKNRNFRRRKMETPQDQNSIQIFKSENSILLTKMLKTTGYAPKNFVLFMYRPGCHLVTIQTYKLNYHS